MEAGDPLGLVEFAVIDARGRVHPFAKPLSIREGGETRRRSAEALGGVAATGPLPIGLIALSTYREAARWRPVEISPGQGLLALIPHTVPLRRRPRASLAALARAVAGARIVEGSRGGAEDAATWLLRHLDDRERGAA